jgi:transcriptional regulator with XRE-family HTH domain
MNPPDKPQSKRKRGVVLSATGWQRLNQAIHRVEAEENEGRRFLAEELSDRTKISPSTLSRLWTAKSGVDRKTLHLLFSAFQLELQESDVQSVNEDGEDDNSPFSVQRSAATAQIPYPSSAVPLESQRYLQRSGVDDRAFAEMVQPGCVIRLKAPSGFGKTSLLLRLLHHAQHLGYATAAIDLRQTDTETLAAPQPFLRWFCAALAHKLKLELPLDDYWDDLLGSNLSTTLYLREAILPHLNRPLVLVFNEVERVFEYPQTAKNLLPLLRSWHEESQHDEVWQQLRLVVAYSTDAYLPLDINQSPFNIGLPLTLPELTPPEVQALAPFYAVTLSEAECHRLIALIGGNPALVGLALYHLHQGMPLADLLHTAPTLGGIYRNSLQRLLAQLNANPHWVEQLQRLVQAETINIDPILAYKLEGIGLIKPTLGGWQFSCELYRTYFQTYVQSLEPPA